MRKAPTAAPSGLFTQNSVDFTDEMRYNGIIMKERE